ncbi:MAG: PadR family transcriptional regulator [Acidobacteria bacterium]|nr:PadR family transcriptional regulator [Acidobacteriota bacterium]
MTTRITYATAAVLAALDSNQRHGFDIVEATGLPGGTVYPALRRLEAAGLVAGDWEDAEAAQARRRPTRRFYSLTAAGDTALAEARSRFVALARMTPEPAQGGSA